MTRMIELNDLFREGHSEIVPVTAVRRIISGWYPAGDREEPSDLVSISEFAEALAEQDYETARDLAAQLCIGFDELAETPDH